MEFMNHKIRTIGTPRAFMGLTSCRDLPGFTRNHLIFMELCDAMLINDPDFFT